MKFKIRCDSIKEFDPQQGAYIKCNRELEVDSAQVGSLVRCPACGNDVAVIDPTMLGTTADQTIPTEDIETESVDDAWGDDSLELVPLDPIETKPAEDEEPFVDPVTEIPAGKSLAAESFAGAPVMGFSPSSSSAASDPETELKKESYNQASGPVLRPASFEQSQTCHKCGAILEEKQANCPKCKTQRRAVYVDKKDRKPFSRRGPFGFQLWLDGLTRGPVKEGETDWFSMLALVFSILLMGAGLSFFIFAGIPGKIVGPVVAFVGYAFFVALRYWGAARKNPRTPVPLLGKFAWVVVLYYVRTLKFSKFAESKHLDKNGDEEFGDQDLAAIKDLAQYKVIDLDGTDISDDGLLYLYDLRGIKYVVLRNTKVTTEGVQDLQQTIPRTWIWY